MQREEINALAQLLEMDKLKIFYNKINMEHHIKLLTDPVEQTLMVPVKDPISGGAFYAGEVLVTSTIVQVEDTKGWAMVMDINKELSLYVAVLDACFAAGLYVDKITVLLQEAKEKQQQQQAQMNKKVNSTKVSFDLM